MASTYQLDFDLPRSGSQQFTLLFKDILDGAVDLTGVAVAIEYRNASGDVSTIATAGVETDDNVTGLVWTDIANGQALYTVYGSIFSAVDGDYEVVTLSHKVRLTETGTPPFLIFGTINLLPE